MKFNGWIFAGLIFLIAENCWFGWNKTPSCTAESVCDYIAWVLIYCGLFRFTINAIADEVEKRIKKHE